MAHAWAFRHETRKEVTTTRREQSSRAYLHNNGESGNGRWPSSERPRERRLIIAWVGAGQGHISTMNKRVAAILADRQRELNAVQQARLSQQEQQGRSPRDYRPLTAGAGRGARPKVTCAMLNETERMLLKAPNRHKSMLSAGTPPDGPLSCGARGGERAPASGSQRARAPLRPPMRAGLIVKAPRVSKPAPPPPHSLAYLSRAGLIFPTENASPPRPSAGRSRPCSAAPHASQQAAAAAGMAGARRGHAGARGGHHPPNSPTRQAAWGVPAGGGALAPKLSPRMAAEPYADTYGAANSRPLRPSTAAAAMQVRGGVAGAAAGDGSGRGGAGSGGGAGASAGGGGVPSALRPNAATAAVKNRAYTEGGHPPGAPAGALGGERPPSAHHRGPHAAIAMPGGQAAQPQQHHAYALPHGHPHPHGHPPHPHGHPPHPHGHGAHGAHGGVATMHREAMQAGRGMLGGAPMQGGAPMAVAEQQTGGQQYVDRINALRAQLLAVGLEPCA